MTADITPDVAVGDIVEWTESVPTEVQKTELQELRAQYGSGPFRIRRIVQYAEGYALEVETLDGKPVLHKWPPARPGKYFRTTKRPEQPALFNRIWFR